jgi:short subunit fatty acids transporter
LLKVLLQVCVCLVRGACVARAQIVQKLLKILQESVSVPAVAQAAGMVMMVATGCVL